MCININISLDETCLVRGDYIGKDLTVQLKKMFYQTREARR